MGSPGSNPVSPPPPPPRNPAPAPASSPPNAAAPQPSLSPPPSSGGPTSSIPNPGTPTGGNGGKKTGLIIGAVAAGVLILGGGAFLLGNEADSDEPDQAHAPYAQPDPGDGGVADPAAPTVTDELEPEVSSDPPDDQAKFRCWDGSPSARLTTCSLPSGREGMNWVFPDSNAANCGRQGVRTRELSVWCYPGPVETHYSEWASVSAAEYEYENQRSTPAARWRGYLRWNITPADGSVKVALVHPAAPFSVTLYADNPSERDRALQQLRLRPIGEVMGQRND